MMNSVKANYIVSLYGFVEKMEYMQIEGCAWGFGVIVTEKGIVREYSQNVH